MPIGIVKWFDCKMGFGFVVHDDGQDVFVHHSVIAGDGFRGMCAGEKVEYDVVQRKKGLSATRVRRLVGPE